ncbi:MAG: helix-turn-helix domain-containing protein [Rhizobiaceae bacterium]|nr:helix-turn-helix domain-containing protein [Rhizobiaceae bacterium]MBL4696987.1 helix-turn-helix domain-containing protein [Rhizobiaceae bacterium]MBL4731797.1 helix-turn-helix domain-containing protein [Rhizobiaceae bacterium]
MIIRKLRMDKGFSQEQLAGMAGVSTRTLQRIERGANASPETLKCLAAVLETDFTILKKEQTMPTENATVLPELQPDEREAMEYVRDIKAFYTHAIQYGVVMVGLTILNIVTSPGYFWAIWPALGWGIGLAAHGLSVFEIINFFGNDWEKRQIERRLDQKRPNI